MVPDRPGGTNYEEIKLLRTRYHKLSGVVSKLVMRTELAEETLREVKESLDGLVSTVSEMSKADEIATEVARRVSHDRRVYFTVTQKLGGLLLVAIALTDFVRGFTG